MSSVEVFLSSLIFMVSASKGHTEVKVRPGQDATLQCRSPRDGEISLLEWIRPELKSKDYVFLYRNNRAYETYQHEFYKGRVELQDPSMKDGDVSVIVRNASTRDTGTYECVITTRNKGVNHEFKCSVSLTVTASGFTDEGPMTQWTESKDGGDRDKSLSITAGLSVFVVLIII